MLRKRLKDASVEKIAQDRIFDDFCDQLLPENLATWTREVTAWEKDTTLPSPYHIPAGSKNNDVIFV